MVLNVGRIIAIANQKGGVGKTTTAVNLGASLGAAEKRTLLVDMDAQANASSGSGVVADGVKDIYHALLGEIGLREIVKASGVPNYFVAPATAHLIGFEVEALELPSREFRLQSVLADVQNEYDYILIDCPPSLGMATLNSLCAADGVLVPLQCEYFAMEGLGRLVDTIDRIRVELNPRLRLEGIILTMYDRRNNLTRQVEEEVSRHFPGILWETRIPRNIRLSEAPSFGKPVLQYDIRSTGAQSHLMLAEEFLRRFEVVGSIEKRGESHDGPKGTRAGDRIVDTPSAG